MDIISANPQERKKIFLKNKMKYFKDASLMM